jgi:hypothetical protein
MTLLSALFAKKRELTGHPRLWIIVSNKFSPHTTRSPCEASRNIILLNTPLSTVTDVDMLGAVTVNDVVADQRIGATSNGDAVLPVTVHLVANEGATCVTAHVYPVTFIPCTQILRSHCPSIFTILYKGRRGLLINILPSFRANSLPLASGVAALRR